MACKLSLNIKEEFINNGVIDKDNNILREKVLDSKIKEIEELSRYKYGFNLPDNTFRKEKISPSISKFIMNEDNINALSEDIENDQIINEMVEHVKRVSSTDMYKLDTTLQERLFEGKEETTIFKILEKIKGSNHPLNKLAGQLLDLAGNYDLPVRLQESISKEESGIDSVIGRYDGGKILINKNGNFKQGKAEGTVLHEILHYFSADILSNFDNKNVKEFEKTYDQAKKYLDNDLYELRNLDEFLVALYTDSEFINKLKDIPPAENVKKYSNLFEQILESLKNLLNISKENSSLFEQAFDISTHIVKEGSEVIKNKYEAYQDFIKNSPDNIVDNENSYMMYGMALNIAREPLDAKQKTETSTEEETRSERTNKRFDEKLVELEDADKRLEKALKKGERALKERIDSFLKSANIHQYKDTGKAESLEERAANLKEIKEQLEKFTETNKVAGALIFAEEARNNLIYINKKLAKFDTNKEEDLEFVLTFYENYIKSFASIPDMLEVLSHYRNFPDNSIEEVDSKKIDEAILLLKDVNSSYHQVKQDFKEYQRAYMFSKLNDINYFPIIETKNIEILEKQYRDNNIKEDKDQWIAKMMKSPKIQEKMKAEVAVRVNKLLNNPHHDESGITRSLGNGIKSKSEIVRVFQHKLEEIHSQIIDKDMQDDKKFKELFNKLKKEKGSTGLKNLYGKILDYDSDGKPYLRGDYKLEVLEANKRMSTIYFKLQGQKEDTKEFKELSKEHKELKDKYFKKDSSEIKDKYKNNYNDLSKTEKEVLDFFKEINTRGNKIAYGRKSLNRYIYKNKDAIFYELPKIFKSRLERTLQAQNPLRDVKEGYHDLRKVRQDDVGYVNRKYDAEGKEIFDLPLHYRDSSGKDAMKPKDQSIDLFTIYRLENKNLNRYEVKKDAELELATFVDFSSYIPSYRKTGSRMHHNEGSGKFEVRNDSLDTNMHKMLRSLFEQQFYDVMNKNEASLVGFDANKIVNKLNGMAAFLSLPFNLSQGTANIVNTKTQLFLESFIKGDIIKAKNIKNAEIFYAKHLKETLADFTRPINKSLVNQINEYFDLDGNMMGEAGDFLATTLAKKGMSKEALQVAQTSGEHWIQSTIILSVLDGIKVRNKEDQYIDKNGKIVATKKEAASMLDMFSQDENKELVVSDAFEFSNFNKLVPFREGGREKIKMLIDNKIYDIVGNYKDKNRPDFYKHWYGKLFGMFRKFFYDMLQRRFKGVSTAAKNKGDLREDQRYYNNALQAYEEGIYTTLARFIITAIRNRELGLQSLRAKWSELTDGEKAGLSQAVGEFALTLVLLPLFNALVYAAFDDDDDNQIVGFILYQARRLESELSQFYSVPELFKILKSPVPSSRLLNDLSKTLGTFFSFGNIFDSEDLIDPDSFNIFMENTMRRTPLFREGFKDYYQLYHYQERSVFGF